jgi:hypothetical protein
MFIDTFYFFVPSRLLYSDWSKIFGENDSPWAQTKSYSVPVVSPPTLTKEQSKAYCGTLADYFGDIVPGEAYRSGNSQVNQLCYRAYAKIVNDWFRDENLESSVDFMPTGEQAFNDLAFSVDNIFGRPFNVNKCHDYFTSCLPSPQKGSAVDIIPNSSATYMPVYARPFRHDTTQHGEPTSTLTYDVINGTVPFGAVLDMYGSPDSSGERVHLAGTDVAKPGTRAYGLSPNNLWGDMSAISTLPTVNDLRFAIQLQKMLERDARGGTRYTEYIQSHFGVDSPDSRLQRSEYLGGSRSPMNISQVTQTSASSDTSPLGNLGAYSLSLGKSGFSKSFVEHGYIIGVACIRYFHTYQQGVDRSHLRVNRVDFYDPVFSSIGEQPVYTRELYNVGSVSDETIFGYNEAWADMRYRSNKISGALRSSTGYGLDIWHFADYYANSPTLNSSFITETPDNIDRCLAVEKSQDTPQFMLSYYFNVDSVRPLPTYSVPGLVDHH